MTSLRVLRFNNIVVVVREFNKIKIMFRRHLHTSLPLIVKMYSLLFTSSLSKVDNHDVQSLHAGKEFPLSLGLREFMYLQGSIDIARCRPRDDDEHKLTQPAL